MKKIIFFALALAFLAPAAVTHAHPGTKIKVAAPAPDAGKKRRYNIADYGAVGDGKTLNTKAIQAVIDKCGKRGGTIVIPKGGVFLSGALFLKPGVDLELQADAVLKGSTDINDYPKINTRIEGHFEPWRTALINGDGVDHLRITGGGTLDGSGAPFWKEFYERRDQNPKTTNLNVERPRLTFIQNSTDVQIRNIKYKNSGFWNLHLYRCSKVVVDSCRFTALHGTKPNNAPSSDGIDVDCSQDVTISRCFFSVGDDCIALKGSKGPFAMDDKASPPVERIRILDCTFEAGGGVVTFGSEATVVRDVEVKRCTTTRPNILRLKLRPDTPQLYENVSVEDITMENGGIIFNVSPWTQYFDLRGQAPPKSIVRNIKIANIKGTGTSLGKIIGTPDTEFGSIVLKDVDVKLNSNALELTEFKGLKFDNVKVNGELIATPAPNTKPPKTPSE